ncbi:hypothetical protein R5W24_001840 [Gemmata sp. JC717]|uniref:hypothetical protein n=1 Tax=Gemmata algarum TaxID=2975278 RepID=UPI0021BA4AA9|nr:hypothetical protein [Gemmata algarum]MDY3552751.1 hypothetical protein [Gemmata algarum]
MTSRWAWDSESVPVSRKERLFCCACVRLVWDRFAGEEAGPEAVEAAEEFADGERTPRGLADARAAAVAACDAWGGRRSRYALQTRAALTAAAECAAAPSHYRVCQLVESAMPEEPEVARAAFQALRDDIAGPPTLTAFAPRWRTGTVTALAAQMYASRDFSAMPILADALQDAGCDSNDILNHCRDTIPHVRGCWVVDRILGQE